MKIRIDYIETDSYVRIERLDNGILHNTNGRSIPF